MSIIRQAFAGLHVKDAKANVIPVAMTANNVRINAMGANLAKVVGHVMVTAKHVLRPANYVSQATNIGPVKYANPATLLAQRAVRYVNSAILAIRVANLANPAKDAKLAKDHVTRDAMIARIVMVANQPVSTAKPATQTTRTQKNMTTQQNNQTASQTGNPPQPSNQQRQNHQPFTNEHIKQMIMDTLIELNLVSQPQKKKVLSDV